MAFYKKFENKTSNQRRSDAFARGGFDNEGAHYRNKSSAVHSFGKTYNGKGEHRQGEDRSQQSYKSSNRFETGNQSNRNQHPDGHAHFNSFKSNKTSERTNVAGRGYQSTDKKRSAKPTPRTQTAANPDRRLTNAIQPEKRYEQYRFQPQRPIEQQKPTVFHSAAHFAAETVEEINENLLTGRNPIREALKTGRDIEKLMVAKGELSGSAREIVEMAKERRIPIQEVDRTRLDTITHNHQGMLAYASAYHYSTLEDMFELAKHRNEPPFLILLDRITDPHNLGAIIRSAECVGAHGVIVQERRAVGLTPAAVKASAGAIEHLPVARVTNLANTIESLKQKGLWIFAADMGGQEYTTVDLSGPIALVIGAEGSGVGSRVVQACDRVISIPMLGHIDSLNASVAAGILMYAVRRSRS